VGKILRIELHGVIVSIGSLASILVGFGFYYLLRTTWPVDQLLIQIPVALITLILGFTAWYLLISRIPRLQRFRLVGWGEFLAVYIVSLAITPLIFLPLHFLTQGYISSADNILSILYFQIPTNFITLLTAIYLVGQPDWLTA
jgi:hypothetical protein